ncbi:molybdopterin converting factor subunit 1 [Acetobacter indonesiensis]|uniref:molybdopterin converting factor subunit 1 n=1 Tax=Acetobacter indonesiensis TaxID=104101 RepID=UPI001F02BA46|nr:molybdopterin converting factor subunit 1 [Acetobacter indonesiensis]MCG0996248.1 molybdopterin converting factor subunit 1 [Acetobacter indonesiensis]
MQGRVTILYFASLREQLGREHEDVALTDGQVPVQTLVADLRNRDKAFDGVFAAMPRIRVAINQELASFQDTVKEGDEVAFFPPMTGG